MINITGLTDSNNIVELFSAVNIISSGLVYILVMLVGFFIILMVFKHTEMKQAIVGASLFTSVIGMIGFALGFINGWVLSIPIIILLFSIVMVLFME